MLRGPDLRRKISRAVRFGPGRYRSWPGGCGAKWLGDAVSLSGSVPRGQVYWLYVDEATGTQTMITFHQGLVAAIDQRPGQVGD